MSSEKLIPGCDRPHGLQLEHVGGQVGDGLFGGFFLLDPTAAADFGQRGPALDAADVFLHQVDFRGRDIDLGLLLEFEHQVLFGLAFLFQQFQSAIATDAVRQVDDVVSFAELEKTVDDPPQLAPRRAVQVGAMEQLVAADQGNAIGHQAKSGLR